MTEDEGALGKVKVTAEVIGAVIKAAGDNPEVKAAGSQLGRTALTLTTALNNCLLPLAAVNFGFEKAKTYFERKFAKDVEEKTKDIPPERLALPAPSIAGQVLQGLAFSHDEAPLREMYLNLLAGAMDAGRAKSAHPAFVEIIRQMTAEEASLFGEAARCEFGAAVERRLVVDVNGQHLPSRSYVRLAERGELVFRGWDTSIDFILQNWSRLGLVAAQPPEYAGTGTPEEWVLGVDVYDEMAKLLTMPPPGLYKVFEVRHLLTQFGQQFAAAVGILYWDEEVQEFMPASESE